MDKIQYCPLSFYTTVEILKPWITDMNNPNFAKLGYVYGVDIKTSDVCSLCSGCVIALVHESRELHGIVIQYDSGHAFRYMHLKSISVSVGDLVQRSVRIGYADKFVHVEYLTNTTEKNQNPVRIGSVTYYKQDPTPYITGEQKYM